MPHPTNHILKTRGGGFGYLIRRLIHISSFVIPLIYYDFGQPIAAVFHITPTVLLWCLIGVVIILEVMRLCFGWLAFGQRQHETKQISSFAWAAVSIFLVLLFAPGKAYAIPIIWSCAFGDPLLGELRRFRLRTVWVIIIGVVFIAGIWWLSTVWLGTPWWWALLMGPLIVASEWPNFRWIDDNATMQLLPLLLVWLFSLS